MSTRSERARRRRRIEEVMAWIILPVILVVMWFVGKEVYTELKEPITSLMQNMDRDI